MDAFTVVLGTVGALSLTVTKVVDLARNAFDGGNRAPKWVWNVAALGIGIAFALGWQLNVATGLVALVPALAGHSGALEGISGELLTGVVIGGASGFWHELLAALSSVATRNVAAASITVSAKK